MSTIPSRSRFAIAAAVLASMASPTIAANDTVYPDLTNVYPLAECAGDCDDENDCQEGLVCLLRDAGTFLDIPGCSGVAEDTAAGDSIDYCVTPRWDILDIVGNNKVPPEAWPLQECQGDCDSDADCDGGLKCFKRDAQEPIVGCYGKGITGEDYCYNPALVEGGCIKPKEMPGYNADGWDYDETYGQLVQDLRAYMHGKIAASNNELIPKYIRLGFHDCVGGICDGCVDLKDGDNKGLLGAMESLKDCQKDFNYMVSRADCFAMATIAASEAAAALDPEVPPDLEYKFTYIGRCDCEGPFDDEEARAIGNGGPERKMPSPDLPTQGLIDFYAKDFGRTCGTKFTVEEFAVASLGSHAPAVGHRFNSGFGHIDPETHFFREDGWVPNAKEFVLSNKYYKSLVDPFWHMQFIDNQNTKVITDEGEVTTMKAFNVPQRFQWYLDTDQKNVFMTNSDIALAVDCEEHLISDIDGIPGLCMCLFSDFGEIDPELEPRIPTGVEVQGNCPSATQTLPYVEKYLDSNEAFHHDFADAMDVMVTNGYVEHRA